uniref:Protein kinase domain-containing protein n=1 Tax=Panagrolaimus sp. ES5 TaxID=591445 RepID=A0AC34FJ98_9BILA
MAAKSFDFQDESKNLYISIQNHNSQYRNLNLNVHRQYSRESQVSLKNIRAIIDKPIDIRPTRKSENSLWNIRDENSNGFLPLYNSQKEGQKQWKKRESSSANTSTLSIHIANYENCMEEDSSNNDLISTNKLFSSCTTKMNQKDILSGGFEMARQESDQPVEPEIMQFKSSQKMLNPNDTGIEKYFANMEIYKEKFKESENKMYYVPTEMLETDVCEKITSWITQAVTQHQFIGNGTFGSASICRIHAIAINYVMKTLKTFLDTEDLKAEIEVLELASKNKLLPRMFYAGFYSMNYYIIIMECVTGGTLLYHVNHKSNISIEAMKVIFFQTSRAIAFLHKMYRTHGDLKLDNVGLLSNGRVKIFDFGKSRNISKPCVLPRSTITYEAPENIQRLEADGSIDWWSFGCLVATMMQKKYPFYHDNDSILASMILNDEPIIEIENEDAKDFIMLLLQKNPQNRLKTPWDHKFLEDRSSAPIFVPGPIALQLCCKNPYESEEQKQKAFGMTIGGKNLVLNDSLLRYPTRRCARYMKNK